MKTNYRDPRAGDDILDWPLVWLIGISVVGVAHMFWGYVSLHMPNQEGFAVLFCVAIIGMSSLFGFFHQNYSTQVVWIGLGLITALPMVVELAGFGGREFAMYSGVFLVIGTPVGLVLYLAHWLMKER